MAFEGVRTATVGGASLAYVERGDGDPVMLVHGAVSDLRTWSAQLGAIGAGHRAVAYSCRFARPNARMAAGEDASLHRHVEDLVGLMDEIGASPAHLVGNSSGALVCLLAAIRYPGRVRRLVLQEPPAMTLFVSPRPRPGELLGLLARRPRTAAAIAWMGASALEPAGRAFRRGDEEAGVRTFLRGVLGRRRFRRLSPARLRQARENACWLAPLLVGGGLPRVRDEEVRRVAAETLLVTGGDSPAFGVRLTERLEELLPRARRLQLPGASHLGHEDAPSAFNAAVVAFLDGRDPPQGRSAEPAGGAVRGTRSPPAR